MEHHLDSSPDAPNAMMLVPSVFLPASIRRIVDSTLEQPINLALGKLRLAIETLVLMTTIVGNLPSAEFPIYQAQMSMLISIFTTCVNMFGQTDKLYEQVCSMWICFITITLSKCMGDDQRTQWKDVPLLLAELEMTNFERFITQHYKVSQPLIIMGNNYEPVVCMNATSIEFIRNSLKSLYGLKDIIADDFSSSMQSSYNKSKGYVLNVSQSRHNITIRYYHENGKNTGLKIMNNLLFITIDSDGTNTLVSRHGLHTDLRDARFEFIRTRPEVDDTNDKNYIVPSGTILYESIFRIIQPAKK